MAWLKRGIVLIVLAGLAAGGWYWWTSRNKPVPVSLRTIEVKRGDLSANISATGTVEPEEVVDVGAQIAGQIIRFGKDLAGKQVDYGSVVDENTVLAEIDDSMYTADVNLARAQIDQAKAGVTKAEADLRQMQAKADQAKRDWDRAQKLQGDGGDGALA
ncbi:MAG: RND transporter, partial [Phycisphaerae bacterium]|nr:RND transporter [Phycisphaerae bacterium]